MPNKNNRILSFRARAKGKKVFPVTMTLSQKQIDWLQRQPNASALIRKILDDLIASEEAVQDKLGVISLNLQLNDLQEKLRKLKMERWNFLMEKKDYWVQYHPEGTISEYKTIFWADGEKAIPKPLDTEDAKVAFRDLQGYDEAIRSLQIQIDETKRKIIQSE